MNGRFRRHADFVASLNNDDDGTGDDWRAAIRAANSVQIGFLIECICNLVENRLPVTEQERSELLPHAELLAMLGRLRQTEKARRALLMHGDKVLPSLVSAVVALSGGLL